MNHIISDKGKVTIYRSVIIENDAIIHVTNGYYGSPWFSNVSVHMNSDELFADYGIYYKQVISISYILSGWE